MVLLTSSQQDHLFASCKSSLLLCLCILVEVDERFRGQVHKLVPFANHFVISLFQLVNATFQIEQISAISKIKSKQVILEYYVVVLSLKTMKLFKTLFVDLINRENVYEIEFRDMGLQIGKIKSYAQEIDQDVEQRLNGGGGVMARLTRIIDRGISASTGVPGLGPLTDR